MRFIFVFLLLANISFADQIDDLIRDLGSKDYETRRAAHYYLSKSGSAAFHKLKAISSKDAEIQLRANELLQELSIAKFWEGSQVQCPNELMPVSDLLALIKDQTGNRFSDLVRTELKNDLLVSSGTYWQVIDEICRKNNWKFSRSHDGKLEFSDSTSVSGPIAYYGPVRCSIQFATRAFSDSFSYDTLSTELSHTFKFNVQFAWEEKANLVCGTTPYIAEAITDAGEVLQKYTDEVSRDVDKNHQFSTILNLNPPSIENKRLKSLKIRWDVVAGIDMQYLKIKSPKVGTYVQDDVEFEIKSMEGTDFSCETVILVTRDRLFAGQYENEMIAKNPAGALITCENHGIMGDGLNLILKGNKPATIMFGYPAVHCRKVLEFNFFDLPLPCNKPQ